MVRHTSTTLSLPLAQPDVLQATFDRAPIGISLHAVDGRVLLANPILSRMLGYSADTLPGRLLRDLLCEHEQDRLARQWVLVMDGQTATLDARYRHADGHEIWGALTMSLLQDEAGGRAVLAYCQDTTSQRRTEESRQENAEKFRIAFEHAASGMSIVGADGKYLAVNPAACRMLGYSEEELLSGSVNMVTHPDDIERGFEWIRKCIAGEPCEEEFEKRFIHKDGRVIWGVITSTWLRDANGKPRMSVSHLRDITFRKQAELALRESEARLREAHDLSRMGHWQLCPGTGSMTWSPGIVRLLGIEPVDGDARPTYAAFLAPVHAQDRAAVEAAFSRTASIGEPCDIVYRLLPPSGRIRYVRVLARLDQGTSGGEARVTGVLQDVTEMREAEEERIRLEGQLHQAQRMEAIGQLAGGVAHDFNNLLTAMSANAQLAMAALLPNSPAQENLMEIQMAIKSAANLTRQLLAFSRRQVVAPRVLDLNEVVRQVSKMLDRLLGENLQLTCRLQESEAAVRIDPGQLDQILINLAVNARDAMPAGGQLTIETANVVLDPVYCRQHSKLVPGPYVRLTMTDTGVGMSAEVRRHLFEPFFTTKEVGRGTGLGLATVYGAVKQNGGHIEVYSEPGQGAIFTIYLPLVDEIVAPPLPEHSSGEVRGGEELLLVEDDHAIRTLAESFLTGLGYKVHAFASGNDALAALGALPESITLLVTDMVMPGIDGKALADQCRHDRPAMKVLFTSGHTQDAGFQCRVLDRSIDFLPKPYSPEELARRVREALDRRP